MSNERVETELGDIEYYLQDAPSQATRRYFSPGKVARDYLYKDFAPAAKFQGQHDENWPVEFPVKTGIAAIDRRGLAHNRVIKTGRGTVCDQELHTIIDADESHETEEYNDIAGKERSTGSETVK